MSRLCLRKILLYFTTTQSGHSRFFMEHREYKMLINAQQLANYRKIDPTSSYNILDIRYGPLISWPPTNQLTSQVKITLQQSGPPVLISMQNFKLYILGTIRTCGRRYIPPETKLFQFCRANIAKIMFLVSDKNVVFVFGVRFTFLFDSKNSRAQK